MIPVTDGSKSMIGRDQTDDSKDESSLSPSLAEKSVLNDIEKFVRTNKILIYFAMKSRKRA